MDIVSYILSKNYTDETAIQFGGLKGASCQIKSINKSDGVTTITFVWKNDDNETRESQIVINDGAKGETGKQGIQGPKGDKGETGEQGPQGDPGTPIYPWTAGTAYAVGDLAIYSNCFFLCIVANSDLTFDDTKWIGIGSSDGNYDIVTSVEDLPEGIFTEADRKIYYVIEEEKFYEWNGLAWIELPLDVGADTSDCMKKGIDYVTAGHSTSVETSASGRNVTEEGYNTISYGNYGHAEGSNTTVNGESGHAEGSYTYANGTAHAEGTNTYAGHNGTGAHAEGNDTTALGEAAHAEGMYNIAEGNRSHAEGYYTTAYESVSHAEGMSTSAAGYASHAEGNNTTALGTYSHAEGSETYAADYYSHAEGSSTTALSQSSHAEGFDSLAGGGSSHAEGSSSAIGDCSHSEGSGTIAHEFAGHAEGYNTESYDTSHAEGYQTTANGLGAHSSGNGTYANGTAQMAIGQYNRIDTNEEYAFIIGDGSSDANRSNLFGIKWNGTIEVNDQPLGGGDLEDLGNVNISNLQSNQILRYNSATQKWVNDNTTVIFSYGNSTWAEVLAAYKANATIYCRASSNSDPSSGSQTRLAFLAYVNNADNPTEIEFQYYRSVSSHTDAQQGDQVFVYEISKTGGWSVTSRNTFTKIAAGTGLSSSYSGGTLTLSATGGSTDDCMKKGVDYVTAGHKEGVAASARGDHATEEGFETYARGSCSHTEGSHTSAHGNYSHAEGIGTYAGRVPNSDLGAHAEGNNTTALRYASHAEGDSTYAGNSRAHAEGQETTASGWCAHSEGFTTIASGDISHAEGYKTCSTGEGSHAEGGYTDDEGGGTFAIGQNSHAEGLGTSALGNKSHAEGNDTISIGDQSHTEGLRTTTSGSCTHAEGVETSAYGFAAHAEGDNTIAYGNKSHASGTGTYAYGDNQTVIGKYNIIDSNDDYAFIIGNGTSSDRSNLFGIKNDGTIMVNNQPYSPGGNYMQKGVDRVTAGRLSGSTLGSGATAEGYNVVASGQGSHAEGQRTTASGEFGSHAEGYGNIANGYASHAEGGYDSSDGTKATKATGDSSHAEGYGTTADGHHTHAEGANSYSTGYNSHAEGSASSSIGNASHAEGYMTSAKGNGSHVEGECTTAIGDYAHAEGSYTNANGSYAHAEGISTYSLNDGSHAEGYITCANNFASHAQGHYNAAMTTGGSQFNTIGTAFVIGNGTSSSALSNAFSVQYDGTVSAAGAQVHPTADYAEFFEWIDGNVRDVDRVGYFVTTDKTDPTKITLAEAEDDYVLGIVSGAPCVIGNGDCDVWNGMTLKDEFGRVIYEEPGVPKYNPKYDPSQPYISRMNRKEWAAVGMLGVLPVRDDGTCQVGGFCTVGTRGTATKVDKYDKNSNCYKVIERINNKVIKVIFK